MYHRIEADDLIGIFATMLSDKQVIIASGDKDLNQISGHHIWIDKEDWGVTDEEAERFRYEQAISGDTVDGIPAAKALARQVPKELLKSSILRTPWNVGKELFKRIDQKGKIRHQGRLPLQQARLTRILRNGEYNFKTHEVKLWNPPTA